MLEGVSWDVLDHQEEAGRLLLLACAHQVIFEGSSHQFCPVDQGLECYLERYGFESNESRQARFEVQGDILGPQDTG